MASKCLIVSTGPVLTETSKRVEGGGLRAWSLAKGLSHNGLDLTVAVPQEFSQGDKEYQGIDLISYNLDQDFADEINKYNSVLFSYSHSGVADFVYKNISPKVQLIADLYVPIHVETSARNPEIRPEEYLQFLEQVDYWNMGAKRADIFLIANSNQKLYYAGFLSALKRINPFTYFEDDMLLELPYSFDDSEKISEKCAEVKGIDPKKDFVILWFGGIYPWFDIDDLVDAVRKAHLEQENIKLLIVGGKNPFNDHSDFNKRYNELREKCMQENLEDNIVYFVDWVDYSDRGEYYNLADVIITINREGLENKLACRTRIVDYIWSGKLILTNGGDSVSETLLQGDAAIRLRGVDKESIASQILDLYNNDQVLVDVQNNLSEQVEKYSVNQLTKRLVELINSKYKAPDNLFMLENTGGSIFQKLLNFQANIKNKGLAEAVKIAYTKLAGK